MRTEFAIQCEFWTSSANMTYSSLKQCASSLDQFRANLDKISPLVTIERTKAHLLLTGAFVRLLDPIGPSYMGTVISDRLHSFLSRAVYRLELYLKHVLSSSPNAQSLQSRDLPPLDVALALHSYVLSPHRLFEDSLSSFPQLLALSEFPVIELAKLIDPVTFAYRPSPDQCAHWEERTGVAFELHNYQSENPNMSISCPICMNIITVLWENNGLGFGEANFSATCTNCEVKVTHDYLCVAKLFSCLRAVRESDNAFLPGTLVNSGGNAAFQRSRLIAREIINIMQSEDGQLQNPRDTSMADIKTKLYCAEDMMLKSEGIEAFMRPFTQATPFSSDIVQMMILQRDFFAKIKSFGWVCHEYLSGPCAELDVACGQYVVFLEFLLQRKGRVIPPVQIDLIWHTHQLSVSRYKENTLTLLGAFLDHVGRDEDIISYSTARDISEQYWKDTFGSDGPTIALGDKDCGASMPQDFEFVTSTEIGVI